MTHEATHLGVFLEKICRLNPCFCKKALTLEGQTEIQIQMKRIKSSLMLCLAILAMALAVTSCKENIDTSARYVFKFNTILSYLEKHEASPDKRGWC